MGNTCTDLCAPADLESTNPCTESFQPFMLDLSVPGMEVEHLGGSRRRKWNDEERRGLHYFAANVVELKSIRLLTFHISFFL